jgi:hypothetical protein
MHRSDDSIKMGLKDVGWEDMDCIHMALNKTSGELW